MEGNNQPFYVGQEVVALKTGIDLVKGNHYHIASCFPCSCGRWLVTLQEFDSADVVCADCYRPFKDLVINAALFAPIQHQYTDISKEILEKFPLTEETPDKVLVPETVNN